MEAMGVIRKGLEWRRAREFFYWRVRCRLLLKEVEDQIRLADADLSAQAAQALLAGWVSEAGKADDDQAAVVFLEASPFADKIEQLKVDATKRQIQALLAKLPEEERESLRRACCEAEQRCFQHVVQRCQSARLLLEEAADRWAEVGRGLVLHVSFSKGIAAEAGADSDAAARCLRQAAKSLLTAPLASSGHWQADHGDSESVVKLCLRGEAQSLLVVPQASLVCKLELGDKNLKYHQQCPRETAAALFEAFASALRAVARELMCTGSRHNQEAYEALAAQRAQAALVPPEEMFKQGDYEGKYSRYDDLGLPTHDKEGAELAKSAMKKLVKLREAQVKKYSKALEKRSSEAPEAPKKAEAADASAREEVLPEGARLPTVVSGTFGGGNPATDLSCAPLPTWGRSRAWVA
ncbi:unnamed protein product [Effrenium voratum]|nr:unnamed protein product [Effrenium voratum]